MQVLKMKSALNGGGLPQAAESEQETLLSAKELAKKLGCSESYIKKLRRLKKIFPSICLPKFVRYDFKSVIAALQNRSVL